MKKNFYFLVSALLILGFSIPSAAQIINTVAGNGTAGFSADGIAATASQLNTPYGVAVDGAGNFYVADYDNNRIRKITAAGVISTIGGTGVPGATGDGGPATVAQIFKPRAVAVDGLGNVYFSDYGNNCVRKISSSGIMTRVAGVPGSIPPTIGGLGDGGPATVDTLGQPGGIAIDAAGNVYIADQLNNRIRKVNTLGIISTVAGMGFAGFSGDGAAATAARLNTPAAVAVDAAGNLFIADYANNKVRKVNTSGIISTIAGVGLPAFGYAGDGGPATAAHLYYPNGIAVDGPGNVYFCDWNNYCIRKISTSGIINTIAGVDTAGFSGDGGPAIHAKMDHSTGVAVRSTGDVYISDNNNNRIRRIKIGNSPFFTNGHNQSITTCLTEFFSIDTAMRVDDIDVGQTETWSLVQPAVHGTANVVYTTTSTGSTLTPTGLTYIPGSVYTGVDSFKVRVTDGTSSDTTIVYVTIITAPVVGVINGIDSVCPGYTHTLTDTTAGGVWSSSNTSFATITSGGVVSGVAPGTVTISYTVTNTCGPTTVVLPFTVISTTPCISEASSVSEIIPNGIRVLPNPSQGIFTVHISSARDEAARVVITNTVGSKVMEFTAPTNKNTVLTLDQPAGIYFITATTPGGRSSEKMTIVR